MDLHLYSQTIKSAGQEITIYFANRQDGLRMKSTGTSIQDLETKLYEEVAQDYPFVERSRVKFIFFS